MRDAREAALRLGSGRLGRTGRGGVISLDKQGNSGPSY